MYLFKITKGEQLQVHQRMSQEFQANNRIAFWSKLLFFRKSSISNRFKQVSKLYECECDRNVIYCFLREFLKQFICVLIKVKGVLHIGLKIEKLSTIYPLCIQVEVHNMYTLNYKENTGYLQVRLKQLSMLNVVLQSSTLGMSGNDLESWDQNFEQSHLSNLEALWHHYLHSTCRNLRKACQIRNFKYKLLIVTSI